MYAVVPFVNGRCHFYDNMTIFDVLLRVFLLKRKKIATQGRNRTLSILISLPYDYTSKPTHQKFQKNLSS